MKIGLTTMRVAEACFTKRIRLDVDGHLARRSVGWTKYVPKIVEGTIRGEEESPWPDCAGVQEGVSMQNKNRSC